MLAMRGGVVMLGAETARERGKEQQEKRQGEKRRRRGGSGGRGEPA